ncbi:MAG: SdrD B-like domain-containing protein [Ferruginibacter sp.]
MKKILVALAVMFIFCAPTKAQFVTKPDPNLRAHLIGRYPSCFNASQMLDTTCTAMVNETNVSMYLDPIIMNWDGFQYYKNLQTAYFSGSIDPPGSTTLPVFPATLKTLNLSALPTLGTITLPPALERLSGSYRLNVQFTSFPSTLRYIYLNYTYCDYLPPLPPLLDTLDIYYNEIANLPPLPASVKFVQCGKNYLSSLPAFLPSSSLKYFGCSENNIATIPVLPDSLETLDASVQYGSTFGNLTTISNFPASLKEAHLGGNHSLSSIPDLPQGLKLLELGDTRIDCVPIVPDGTSGLEIRVDDNISCVPNHPSPSYYLSFLFVIGGFSVWFGNSSDSFALCNPVNNPNGCQALPAIKGYVFNDYNGNGVKDANEPYRANVKLQLSNGAFTTTNSNGYYQISTYGTGNFTLTITPPNYFTALPLQYSYNFTNYDTLVTRDFPLQATAVADGLSISVLPVNAAARPGFSYPYAISYANVGTTSLTPNIVFNYDNTRLTYDSSSNAAVINIGSSLTLAEAAMPFGQQKQFTGYFKVKPTAVIGDSIKAYVSIHANAITVSDSTTVRIRGSFDPNDKSATTSLSTTQVANGNYIYYTVRFQNTGTDTAFNIVISDSLNAYLQPSTLEVINTSHPARTTVRGDMVYCEFQNILLPDSNVNKLKSHGYVSFRIKPKPTATVGSVIPNKAKIYFDYNTPVITAVAQTTIYDASPTSRTYTFNGTGNWTTAANWVGGVVPPSTLQAGDHVVINGSCILNVVVTANSGSSIVVVTGKSFFVNGNLVVQ